jgi:penicillin amidase
MRPSSTFLAAALLPLLAPALAGCYVDDETTASSGTTSTSGGATTPLGASVPVDERLQIDNLSGPVDVIRDKYGRPHIYATTVPDAMRVEGYLVASDRTFQMEFYRRVSEGRLSEILSDTTADVIDLDISYRHIGLARTAQAQYDALPAGDLKDAVDAYADGVSQLWKKIADGFVPLPDGIIGIPRSAFTPWTGVDSLAVARFQTYELSYDADTDVSNTMFFDAARSTFTATDPDPSISGRAGLERDLFRFAPADPATTTTGYPTTSGPGTKLPPHLTSGGPKAPDLLKIAPGYLAAMHQQRRLFTRLGFGSNNWAVSGTRSQDGHALVASDPHLELSAPAVFWPVSIQVKAPAGGDSSQNLSVGGLAFPGIPGIILGHNANIGWGATVAGYDVSDAYAETVTPDGSGVVYQGKDVPFQTIDETIVLQSGPPYVYQVQVVPEHGPILPNIQNHVVVPADPATGAVSIKWTGFQPTHELEAVFDLLRATDVDSAYTALQNFGVGGQNWMIADTNGDILWTSHVLVPMRDPRSFKWDAQNYTGTLPCMILPGDGTAEWEGFLPDALVPWEKNPAAGYISTANNDPIGVTLDNDPSNKTLPDGTPMYLHCMFDVGFREGRIHTLLAAQQTPFVPPDLATIQGDVRSATGSALVPELLAALAAADAELLTPGTHPDLATVVNDPAYDAATMLEVSQLLTTWGSAHDFDALSGIDPDTNMPLPATGTSAGEVEASQATLIFNAWFVRLLTRTFGDELAMMNVSMDQDVEAKAMLRLVSADPTTLATYDAATGDSLLWDDITTPTVLESRYDRMVRAMLDALSDLSMSSGTDLSAYRWGSLHTVTFTPDIPFFTALAIPPAGDTVFPNGFPRHGDSFCIDASQFTYAAATDPQDFTYGAGPTQRFVADMDPAGPVVANALPGGNIWYPSSPHFRDEAEYWRRNETHPVPFLLADVLAAKETHILATP